uniref:Uncharacterized protein n=1 Tax=Bradyrhizobium septentrionale TaxID=1404411 RepID=A0A973VZL6_9BRAD
MRGAAGILDEVDEARRVVERLADMLEARDIDVTVFHNDVSQSQSENLEQDRGLSQQPEARPRRVRALLCL